MHVAIVAIISMSLSAENRTHDFIERLEECQLISREELGSLISLRCQSRVEPDMRRTYLPWYTFCLNFARLVVQIWREERWWYRCCYCSCCHCICIWQIVQRYRYRCFSVTTRGHAPETGLNGRLKYVQSTLPLISTYSVCLLSLVVRHDHPYLVHGPAAKCASSTVAIGKRRWEEWTAFSTFL